MANPIQRERIDIAVSFIGGPGLKVLDVGCLLPAMRIIANPTIKQIEDVAVGDRVFTQNGTFQPVRATMKRLYEGEILTVKPKRSYEELKVTPEHPILAVKGRRLYGCLKKGGYKPEWIQASSLTEEHLLVYPVPMFSEYPRISLPTLKKRWNRRYGVKWPAQKNLAEIPEFLRFMGYFLSEGSNTRIERSRRYEVVFSFSKDEAEYIRDVIYLTRNLFGLTAVPQEKPSEVQVSVHSKQVSDILVSCGLGAKNKRLPIWVLSMRSGKLVSELLKGLYRGDGGLDRSRFCYTTTSETLANQLRMLLLKFGIISSVAMVKSPPSKRVKAESTRYELRTGGRSLVTLSKLLGIQHPFIAQRNRTFDQNGFVANGYLFVPIDRISREWYSGPVYNLSIEGQESYSTISMMVHNCGDGAISELIHNNGNECWGMDLPDVVATIPAERKKWLVVIAGDASKKPWAGYVTPEMDSGDGFFDIIWAGEIIEHMIDLEPFLSEAWRVLKPDGRLVLTTPNAVRSLNRVAMLFGQVHTWHEWDKIPHHIRYFTPQTLQEAVSKYGFKPFRIASARSQAEGGDIGFDSSWLEGFSPAERAVVVKMIDKQPSDWRHSFIILESQKVVKQK